MRVPKFACRVLSPTLFALLFILSPLVKADIIHRYSFNGNDASDSVGTANGTLHGTATVHDGQLFLDGTDMTYVDIPIGADVGSLLNITVEAWVTWNTNAGQPWARIFDFGSDTDHNMFLTPMNGNNQRVRFAITVSGGGNEEQTTAIIRFPVGAETHVVVTLDGDNQVTAIYMNGRPVVIEYGGFLAPLDLGTTTNNYLGRSQYADPFFNGSINEFRIYNTALSADAILNSFMAGPDAP
jgi:hypothetical protein